MGHYRIPLVFLVLPGALFAQEWDAPAVRDLVARAVDRRANEAGGPGGGYRALARGLVTFHAEIGPPGTAEPHLLKADELEVEVYWEPGRPSKQRIRAWRDSTFLPTGVVYHRDHLGIVADDFGESILIGEGDEVAAVPHPVSTEGLARYQFRAGSTVRVATVGGEVTLVAVDVRPRDFSLPLAVGTVYLDQSRAAVVRARLSFTPAAYREPDLESITVLLERALVDERRWLPFRQEIEIRRRSAVVAFPLSGVIRGRWEIEDFQPIAGVPPAVLAGPAIGGLAAPGGVADWSSSLAATLATAQAGFSEADPAGVRRAAARLAAGRLLDGLPRLRLAANGLSEVMRVNRVQGLAIGAGLSWRLPETWMAEARLGIGTADGRVTGRFSIGRGVGPGRLWAEVGRSVEDVAPEWPVASGLIASLAAQESGVDWGDYVLLERIGLRWRGRLGPGISAGLSADREWAWSVSQAARPARGEYRPNPALGSPPVWVGRFDVELAASRSPAGTTGRAWLVLEGGAGPESYGRLFLRGERIGPAGPGELGVRFAVGAGAGLPARRAFVLGGRGTVPGEAFRQWGGARAFWGSAEWLAQARGPALPLGRLGRTGGTLRVGPLVGAGWAAGQVAGAPWEPSQSFRPVAGLVVELFDRLLRVEFAQPLRGGRRPGVAADVARAWWPVL